ncbi:MAG: Txe/YoeB family addiction module toxin [Bacteroidales bacterium]|nr:Txe/YoeB family addiction module toxin [Bacteroidales bacterium]MCD8393500.1 Txe/YoeB family addiction module toxin [Bacteroidales bacterium]
MSYRLILNPRAQDDWQLWIRSGQQQIVNKILNLFEELKEHPYTGTGQVEPLKGNFAGSYSRRINKQHRMVYKVEDNIVTVVVLRLRGHYNDK